jgi:nicotinamide phosphoribosyltransferase
MKSLDHAKNLEQAKEIAHEFLRDQVCEDTPHGERGEHLPEGYFCYNGVAYLAQVEIEWDRYDKQYYYIENTELKSFEPVELTPEQKGAVECLWDIFGGETTDTGHRALDRHIGLIYGDSITLYRAHQILERLRQKGFASSNVVFGVGSYTYQHVTRDSYGFAVKSTYGEINGEPQVIFKDPITDIGTKRSARGLLRVDEHLRLHDQQTPEEEATGMLAEVFVNGRLLVDHSLQQIRERLA